jgi:hypothetical protein
MLLERSPTPEPTSPGLPDRRYSEPDCALSNRLQLIATLGDRLKPVLLLQIKQPLERVEEAVGRPRTALLAERGQRQVEHLRGIPLK